MRVWVFRHRLDSAHWTCARGWPGGFRLQLSIVFRPKRPFTRKASARSLSGLDVSRFLNTFQRSLPCNPYKTGQSWTTYANVWPAGPPTKSFKDSGFSGLGLNSKFSSLDEKQSSGGDTSDVLVDMQSPASVHKVAACLHIAGTTGFQSGALRPAALCLAGACGPWPGQVPLRGS